MKKIAVYPGTFDPITNGHLDLLARGLKIFDKVIVAVAHNPGKKPLFTLEERLDLIKQTLEKSPLKERVVIDSFDGLLVEYLRKVGAQVVLRGLRAMSDFEYEFQMALMNRKLSNEMETLFLMTGLRWIYISSRLIKEVAEAGGCVKGLVPEPVEEQLIKKLIRT